MQLMVDKLTDSEVTSTAALLIVPMACQQQDRATQACLPDNSLHRMGGHGTTQRNYKKVTCCKRKRTLVFLWPGLKQHVFRQVCQDTSSGKTDRSPPAVELHAADFRHAFKIGFLLTLSEWSKLLTLHVLTSHH